MPGTAYAERTPISILRPYSVCSWTSDSVPNASDANDRILPDACIDIVFDGNRVFVAGPDTGPVFLPATHERTSYAGVRFRPGAAPALLGLPAYELRDQRVALADVWGAADALRVTERLARTTSSSRACDELERALVERLDAPVDRLATGAVNAIATDPSARMSVIAARLGVTDRTLHRRVQSAVGYGPKVLQRVVRFRRFLASAHLHDSVGLAALAGRAGYADQAHLTRECNALAGLTPLELVRRSHVRLVQDGLDTIDERGTSVPLQEGVEP